MPIEKISSTQFADDIATGINDRAPSWDTGFGPVRDQDIQPQSVVFERQNDRVRKLSLLLTLANADEFTGFESDLNGIVFNEGMTRILGTSSTISETFSRSTAPTIDAVVQRGFPIGSLADESTGATITFLTSEARVLPAASAGSFFNLQTQKYELAVPMISVIEGSGTRVGPNRVTKPLRPLGSFETVTNPEAAAGGRDQETNAELIERYLLAIVARQLSVALGIERVARADFPDATDVAIVRGNDPLLTRAGTDAGAVDAWVMGEAILQTQENITFLGVGQLLQVALPPLVSVVSVSSGANVYIEGSDYEVIVDDTGIGRSTRGADGVSFLVGGPTPLPTVGNPVTVTYRYNNLIRALQTGFEQDDTFVLGRDLLFRRAEEVPIAHQARLRVSSGFSATAVLAAVQTAVLAFVNGLQLGNPVEGSDIQAVVRAVSGVDNYIIDRLTRTTVLSGTADIAIGKNEFPTLASADLVISLI